MSLEIRYIGGSASFDSPDGSGCSVASVALPPMGGFTPSNVKNIAGLCRDIAHEILANHLVMLSDVRSALDTQVRSMECADKIFLAMENAENRPACYDEVQKIRKGLPEESQEQIQEIVSWGVAMHVRDHIFGVRHQ